MLRFFIVDWILTYLNTPELQRTPADEVHFMLLWLGLYVVIAMIVHHFKKKR